MSVNIINNLISTFCLRMKANIDNVIIKTFKFDKDCYTLLLEFNDEIYSIRHFEPIIIVPGVNYGAGPYHQYDIFNKNDNIFQPINLN